jgi:hypothetical protein
MMPMKLTIELPGKVFDQLVKLAIHDYRTTPMQAAHILERHVMAHDQPHQKPRDAGGVRSRDTQEMDEQI